MTGEIAARQVAGRGPRTSMPWLLEILWATPIGTEARPRPPRAICFF